MDFSVLIARFLVALVDEFGEDIVRAVKRAEGRTEWGKIYEEYGGEG